MYFSLKEMFDLIILAIYIELSLLNFLGQSFSALGNVFRRFLMIRLPYEHRGRKGFLYLYGEPTVYGGVKNTCARDEKDDGWDKRERHKCQYQPSLDPYSKDLASAFK
jgi:hypothetical protein